MSSVIQRDQRTIGGVRRRPTGGRWGGVRLALLIGLAGALPAFLGVWALNSAQPTVAERRAELAAYLGELKPLAEETGFLVIHGLRAGVNDIGTGAFSDEILQQQPVGWRRDLEQLKDKFAAVKAPGGLEDAHQALAATLDGYIEVTHQLEAAAHAPVYRRRMLVRRAADLGQRIDREWNVGAYQIQWALDEVGEDMVIWLPDPTVNPDSDDYVDGDPDEARPNDFMRETGVQRRLRASEAASDA
ncbi:MAG TPA: hypothetical protein VNU01_04940 [Egibacteraceae bacterium]|nr:hypothetical protein [Egibacteraceae bacterium]